MNASQDQAWVHALCLGMHTCTCICLHAEAEQQLRVHGRNELEEKHTSKLLIFLKLVSMISPVNLVLGSTPYRAVHYCPPHVQGLEHMVEFVLVSQCGLVDVSGADISQHTLQEFRG